MFKSKDYLLSTSLQKYFSYCLDLFSSGEYNNSVKMFGLLIEKYYIVVLQCVNVSCLI